MNAILLCPGPSLAEYQPQTADLTVGVNRAACFSPCDVWVAGDPPLIQQQHEWVIGAPELITSTDGLHVYQTFPRDFGVPLWRGACRCWTEMLGYCPHALDWVMFSATAALIYCGWRGARRIDVYGADWKPLAADFDGVQAGKNRSMDRFTLESNIWQNRLVPWLATRGVEVLRHSLVKVE